ncbi:PREDICTED: uncharacterized protein LOC108559069 [Nicrophorus vespilloides]|uniref:Uncharacterized protein LOC108559069 n=1 Tax=Nicrophorus vespilloides TaxID=110193 RepID=A0ABM1MAT6_NICVS|nr:PREDICTED: uncharacterized protein LOC108559069 [Nicrophorus vespilloides]
MLTSLIVSKFNNLYDATNLALQVCTTTGNTSALEQVSLTHQQINGALKEINRCFGIQMLMGITSSLYTTIYYLYRICTINYIKTHSNPHEQIHYFLSLLYRSCKLIIYTVLGHNISNSSKKPLEAFQNTRILQFPSKTLEQIQLLVILWQGQQATLSGFSVVNIGPWLLAPIVGNVITYLLVALQFQNSGPDISQNVSAYLEYVL